METPPPQSPPPKPEKTIHCLTRILSESNHIVKSERRVINSLAGLFLLPITTTLIFFPYLKTLPTLILMILSTFAAFFNTSALGSISFAAFNNNKNTSLSSAIKSLYFSPFHYLLIIVLLYQTIIFAFYVYFDILDLSITIAFVTFFMAYLLVSCFFSLVFHVIVFEPIVIPSGFFNVLRRSYALLWGNRLTSLCLGLFFGVLYIILYWIIVYTTSRRLRELYEGAIGDGGDWWFRVVFLGFLVLINACLMALVLRCHIVTITVLYVFCVRNVDRGGEDFSGEYLSLPVNDTLA